MRVVIVSVILAAALIGPIAAHAQKGNLSPVQQIEENKKKAREEADKEYQRTMRATDTTGTSVKVDPWANMRSPDDSKAKK